LSLGQFELAPKMQFGNNSCGRSACGVRPEPVVSDASGNVQRCAASRSVIDGTDFGDNLMAALPDTLGQTIGGIIADGVAGAKDKSFANSEAAKQKIIDSTVPADVQKAVKLSGGTFEVDENGAVRVVGYDGGALQQAVAGSSTLHMGTDGSISGSTGGWNYLPTARGDNTWLQDTSYDAGLNFYFHDGMGTVQSDWVGWEGDAGVVRFISQNGGPTYVYNGGEQYFAGLNLTISAGPSNAQFVLPPTHSGFETFNQPLNLFGSTSSFQFNPYSYSYGGKDYTPATYPGPVIRAGSSSSGTGGSSPLAFLSLPLARTSFGLDMIALGGKNLVLDTNDNFRLSAFWKAPFNGNQAVKIATRFGPALEDASRVVGQAAIGMDVFDAVLAPTDLSKWGKAGEDYFFYKLASKGGIPGAVVAGTYGGLEAFYPGGANKAVVDAWQYDAKVRANQVLYGPPIAAASGF
jgi:hypothetical protein